MTLSIDAAPRVSARANHSNVVTSVAFMPDGQTLASGSWDGTIKLWAVRDGRLQLKRTLRGEWDEVDAVAIAPDGREVAGLGIGWDGAAIGVVTLWEPEAGRGRPLIRSEGRLDALAFAPDGATLATASGDSRAVTFWDVASGRELSRVAGHRDSIWSVAFAPDGRLLAVASGVVPAVAERAGGGDRVGEVRLWDLSGPEPVVRASLVGHEYGALAVTFSPDGATLASGGFDRVVRLWDVATGEVRATLDGHEGWVAALAFSPDGATLATGSHDHTIKFWDVATGREHGTLHGHTGNVYSVAFSPDGTRLASGSMDGTVRLWDIVHESGRSGGNATTPGAASRRGRAASGKSKRRASSST